MKRLEMGVPGFGISVPVPDDIETNREAQKAFLKENEEDILLLGLMRTLFGRPTLELHDCGQVDGE